MDIDVVIPAFNRAKSLTRALQSVVAQVGTSVQRIIVVDDASTDDTADIAATFGAHVVRMETNSGAGPARNAGVAQSTAEWIAFLDADDEWLPTHLTALRNGIEMCREKCGEDVRLVSTRALVLHNGAPRRYNGAALTTSFRILHEPQEAFLPSNPFTTSATLLRRDAFNVVHGFRSFRRAQDMDLWIRVCRSYRALLLADVTVKYYQEGSLDAALVRQSLDDARAVLRDFSHDASQKTWWKDRYFYEYCAVQQWDALRNATTFADAARPFAELLRHPIAAARLYRLFQTRAHLRRM